MRPSVRPLPWTIASRASYAPGEVGAKAVRFPRVRPLPTAEAPAAAARSARRAWARLLRPPFHRWWKGADAAEEAPSGDGAHPSPLRANGVAAASVPAAPSVTGAPVPGAGRKPPSPGPSAEGTSASMPAWPTGGLVARGRSAAQRARDVAARQPARPATPPSDRSDGGRHLRRGEAEGLPDEVATLPVEDRPAAAEAASPPPISGAPTGSGRPDGFTRTRVRRSASESGGDAGTAMVAPGRQTAPPGAPAPARQSREGVGPRRTQVDPDLARRLTSFWASRERPGTPPRRPAPTASSTAGSGRAAHGPPVAPPLGPSVPLGESGSGAGGVPPAQPASETVRRPSSWPSAASPGTSRSATDPGMVRRLAAYRAGRPEGSDSSTDATGWARHVSPAGRAGGDLGGGSAERKDVHGSQRPRSVERWSVPAGEPSASERVQAMPGEEQAPVPLPGPVAARTTTQKPPTATTRESPTAGPVSAPATNQMPPTATTPESPTALRSAPTTGERSQASPLPAAAIAGAGPAATPSPRPSDVLAARPAQRAVAGAAPVALAHGSDGVGPAPPQEGTRLQGTSGSPRTGPRSVVAGIGGPPVRRRPGVAALPVLGPVARRGGREVAAREAVTFEGWSGQSAGSALAAAAAPGAGPPSVSTASAGAVVPTSSAASAPSTTAQRELASVPSGLLPTPTASIGSRTGANGADAPLGPASSDAPPSGGGDSTTILLDHVDELMTRLEERVLEELERRGGRFAGLF